MKKTRILVIGAGGQIGSELTPALRKVYGSEHVVASDIKSDICEQVLNEGPFEILDCMDEHRLIEVIIQYKITRVYHLVALLSAVGEHKPLMAWNINVGSLMNVLEIARELHLSVFIPSSIGAFGPSTPKKNTPQDTLMRPTTIYGITKVCGEMLGDYYFKKYGVDTRGLRYPGIISNATQPGGGTTDYAVEIFYKALEEGRYTCYLKEDTYLDMMYMPDAVRSAIEVMEADPDKLVHRNAFNVSAMSFSPRELKAEIQKHIPDFQMECKPDPVKQAIADSWPDNMDDSAARQEWGWNHEYDLSKMTEDMLKTLKNRQKHHEEISS
ncbi:TPA: UDP-glucose 4-epimerase [Candidatus Marinimicrobia bacterium]|nr:MAG: L-threonine 3-dehydrogenase [Marinimicrobia bacterium 46_47]KUK90686.1 MAG: nucleoside-diphosphate-sugar epimerase [Marinimicrobia bacterium 46_43]HAE86766.1 UDP-glucose 4-epimerase [Candidatus Neomarinimicrobiota bacterium]HBY18086.1 UDP-glucose 4-epimerase [Candidatus Neomarinimicrobiota bacterium]